jgi:geranylgeranyl diphosphate synthase type 3
MEPHQQDPSLLEAFRYINSVPGKDVRGKLIDCFELWLKVENAPAAAAADTDASDINVLDQIKDIVGDLHNASLLIDDIEDNSKLRRGNPVAHSIFGIPNVINTANYVYFLALEKVQALQNPQAMHVFCLELLNLHRGQGHDIVWRDSMHCPTEDEYCHMVVDKTGGLFRLAVGLMQAFSSCESDFAPLVNNLAMYFQIRDDFINLADDEYMKSKSFCEDLTEGKFSFPILHCIRLEKEQGDTRLQSILQQRTDDVDVKRYAQTLMRESGSLLYTRQKCSQLKQEIIEQVNGFGGNAPLLAVLEMLDVQLDGMAAGGDDSKDDANDGASSPTKRRQVDSA